MEFRSFVEGNSGLSSIAYTWYFSLKMLIYVYFMLIGDNLFITKVPLTIHATKKLQKGGYGYHYFRIEFCN